MKVLDKIVRSKLEEITSMRSRKRDFKASLNQRLSEPLLICEVKPASPSEGSMRDLNQGDLEEKLEKLISAYKKEATAISVLTDQPYFGGSYKLLEFVKAKTDLPVLQKDFILDEIQMVKGLASGADAALLIVGILDQKSLKRLYKFGKELGIDPVVEINNERDKELALEAGAEIILINNRNLDSLEIDLDTTRRLAEDIPENVLIISASGYQTGAQIKAAAQYCDAYLVGSSLMKSENPLSLLKNLKGG